MIPFEREIFHLSDGAAIAIDWYEKIVGKQDKRPLLVCVGGLGGCGQNAYMKAVIRAMGKKGFKIAFASYMNVALLTQTGR